MQANDEATRNDIVWLYCLVFPASVKKKQPEEVELERNAILDQLANAGLVTNLFYSSKRVNIFCKVGATESRLLLEADIQDYRLRLEPTSLKQVCESDRDVEDYGRAPIFLEYPYKDVEIQHDFKKRDIMNNWVDMSQTEAASFVAQETHLSPFEDIFVRYNDVWEHRILKDHGVQIYKTYDDGTILRPADRIKLCKLAMERNVAKDSEHGIPGAGIFVKKLIFEKQLVAAYPLQLGTTRQASKELTPDQLFDEWNSLTKAPWSQPLDKIRDYAGEKVAMYFAFLGHYTLWLISPALIGTIIFVRQLLHMYDETGSFDIVGPGSTDIVNRTDENGNTFLETQIHTQVAEAPFFALFIALWATFMIEFWKRKQARIALRWGMSNFEKSEKDRIEFRPSHVIPSAVTGEPVSYYSRTSFFSKVIVSASVLFSAIAVVAAAIFGILALKVFMSAARYNKDFIPDAVAPQIALVVNAVVIIALGIVYKKVAIKLNDWENHRTDVQYEDHLIAKTFVFSFVNSYSTLTYMAFIKSGRDIIQVTQYCVARAEELAEEGFDKEVLSSADLCYGSLAYSLFIIFASQIIVNNTIEIGRPIATAYAFRLFNLAKTVLCTAKKQVDDVADQTKAGIDRIDKLVHREPAKVDVDRDDDEEKADIEIDLEDSSVRKRMRSPCEHQLSLQEYTSPFDDYLEMALQFGYVTLFVAAFPIAPLLALLNNFLEVRVDSFKVCVQSRRPDLEPAQDIGNWQYIFEIMGFAAVISNASVILFTSNFIEAADDTRVWLWVLFVGFVMTFKTIVDWVISDVPREVRIQIQRTEFFERKIFLLERDDEELSPEEKRRNSHRYSLSRVIHTVDPFINELVARAAEALRTAKGEDWDMTSMFANIDQNSNEQLSLKEIKNALLADKEGLINYLSRYEIEILVSAMDVDGDGTINPAEFKRFLNF